MIGVGVGAVLGLTFVAPLAGAVAGVLGCTGVLLFYFLKLRRRPVRVSTLAFWEEAASDLQVNAPFKMVRASWILLLQLLAVLLLAAALARPEVEGTVTSRDVFVVIDRSASMSARDGGRGGPTRLEEAKRAAVALIDRLPSDARVSVISFAGDARAVVDATTNRREARLAIERMTGTDEPADIGTALRVLGAFVNRGGELDAAEGDEDGDEGAPGSRALVALVSDGNFGRPSGEGAPLGGAEVRYVRVGPAGEPGANVGITSFAAKRDFADPALVRVFARLGSNRGPGAVGLRVTLDGVELGSRVVELDEAGVGSHTFGVPAPRGGLVRVSVVGDGGALASDDSAAVYLLAPARPSVALVQPEGGAGSAGGFALVDALEALATSRLDVFARGEAARRGLLGPRDGGRFAIEGYDLLVYDRVTPMGEPGVASIVFDGVAPGARLAPLAGDASGGAAGRGPGAGAVGFGYWRRDHPVMRAVSLGDVIVDAPLALGVTEGDPGGGPGGGEVSGAGGRARVVELANSDAGALIVLTEGAGASVLTVGFAMERTNWWRFPGFPLFIANAVEYLALRPEAETGVSARAGERIAVGVGDGAGAAVRVVYERTGGDGDGAAGRLEVVVGAGGRGVGEGVERAGVYELVGDATRDGPPRAIGVNVLSERESLLANPELVSIGGGASGGASLDDVAPRAVWPWFVLAGFVVLSAEWVLFAGRLGGWGRAAL